MPTSQTDHSQCAAECARRTRRCTRICVRPHGHLDRLHQCSGCAPPPRRMVINQAGSSMVQATMGRQPCVPEGLLSPSDYRVTGMRSQWACEFTNCRNAAVAECRGSCAYYMCTAHLDGSCGACGLAPMCDLCLVFHECSELQPVVRMRQLTAIWDPYLSPHSWRLTGRTANGKTQTDGGSVATQMHRLQETETSF